MSLHHLALIGALVVLTYVVTCGALLGAYGAVTVYQHLRSRFARRRS